MLILGLDPGTATTGYGLLNITDSSDFEVYDLGLIETHKDTAAAIRLVQIHDQICTLIEKYKPDVMVIEKVFFATNAKTAIRVGQAQGVMLFCAANHNLECMEYAPGTIKKMISGNGRSNKKEMQQALRKIFGPKVRSKPMKKTHFDNAADALAIALTHAYTINKIVVERPVLTVEIEVKSPIVKMKASKKKKKVSKKRLIPQIHLTA
jgi:crossover junction endodeoxyribonuclease RuvC